MKFQNNTIIIVIVDLVFGSLLSLLYLGPSSSFAFLQYRQQQRNLQTYNLLLDIHQCQKFGNNNNISFNRGVVRQSKIKDDDDDDTQGQENRHWLKERFNMTENKQLSRMEHYRYNAITTAELNSRANWIMNRLGFTDKEMDKIIQRTPKLLSIGSYEIFETSLDCLGRMLELDKKSLKAMILKQPSLLHMKEEKLNSKFECLQNRLGMDTKKVRKILRQKPQILVLHIEDNIITTIDWLQRRLSLTNEEVSKVIYTVPTVVTISITGNLEPKLQWIQQRLSLTDSGLSNVILKQSKLLSYGINSNLAPKIDFYIKASESYESESEVLAYLGRNPRLLSTSLKNRLVPRFEEARDAGLVIDVGCLQRMAKYTDDAWNTSIKFQSKFITDVS